MQGISGLDNAQTIMDLTGQIPDIISDLLGYSVVPQLLQENQLLAGDTFNTTNVVKTGSGVNGVPAYIPIGIKTTTELTQVRCCREHGSGICIGSCVVSNLLWIGRLDVSNGLTCCELLRQRLTHACIAVM